MSQRNKPPVSSPIDTDRLAPFIIPFPGRQTFDASMSEGAEEMVAEGGAYRLFTPVHYEPGYPYPLLLWLHAPGGDESQLFEVMPMVSLRNYVAVAPRGLSAVESGVTPPFCPALIQGKTGRIRPMYDWPQTARGIEIAENRLFEMIDRASETHHIGRGRIFLAGAGSGGSMALRIGARHPESFAGVISLCGAFPEEGVPLRCWSRLRTLPILMTVGVQSGAYSPEAAARQLKLFHAAGMSVSIRQYKSTGEATAPMFRDLDRWMMESVTASGRKAA